MSTCRGMKMYRQTKQSNKNCIKSNLNNPNELPPKRTIWDARVGDEEKVKGSIDSITCKTDVLKMTRPGIIQDDIPIYFNGHYFEIMNSSKEGSDVVLKNVYDAENISYEKSADDKLLFFDSNTTRVVDAFTNFGCLFLHKESNDVKLNYTILCKSDESSQEGVIKFEKQNIYVYCDAINEEETSEGKTKYTPINPRKIRALDCDVSKVTFYFFTVTKSEKKDVETEVIVLNEPYHFVPGTSEEDKTYGKGELVEGAPDGEEPDDSEDSDDEDGDIFVPVYPEGTVDSEGNDISGKPITNSDGTPVQRLENKDTINDEELSDVEMEINGETVHVDFRGAFPVTQFVGSNFDVQYESDGKTPLSTKYVFVYYQIKELLKGSEDGEEDTELVGENIKINFLIGNHFTVENDEALILYQKIEQYDINENGINKIIKKVEIEHYPCNVLYYNKPGNEDVTINEYKIMEYKGLYILGTVQSNVEYVNGNFNIYSNGKLSCYAPVDSQHKRFRLLNLVISDEASIYYREASLKCSDVYQEKIVDEEVY